MPIDSGRLCDPAGTRDGGVYGGQAADGGTGEFSPGDRPGDDGPCRHHRRPLSVGRLIPGRVRNEAAKGVSGMLNTTESGPENQAP